MRFLTSVLILLSALSASGSGKYSARLLAELDSALSSSEKLNHAKDIRIDQLRKRLSPRLKDEERLWLNKMLYDEYYVYKVDSAMKYVEDNLELTKRMKRKDLQNEWRINKVFLLTAEGLLSEAEKELRDINLQLLDNEAKCAYFETTVYLYSHLQQYAGASNGLSRHYDSLANNLRHQAIKIIPASNPAYLRMRASILNGPSDPEWKKIKAALKERVDKSQLNSRANAIDAYSLAKMYLAEGNKDGHINYLAKSAIADIRICNRDIASLEELAYLSYQEGDIERAYSYINECLKAALLYPNRVRVVNISSLMDKLQQASETRSRQQEHKLSIFLIAVSILSGVLLIVAAIIIVQFFKLKHSHQKLVRSKSMLKEHMDQLHSTQAQLSDVNNELNETVEKLRESNESLMHSNFVKEEYVGYVFSICSEYLSKIEQFRKEIGRKLKVGKIDDVRAIISNQMIDKKELQDFYHRFDMTFLHLYPHFVADFNSLLRPEEQISLKKGELLNTELRIYALVRLGINDSVKIAEFLHMSAQTIYNTRLKTRNKSIVPKEKFTEMVRNLGKQNEAGN